MTHLQLRRVRRMRITRIGLIAAAMLAGGMGIAAAQTSTTTPSPNAASSGTVKCWDSVTNQVRNETPSSSTSTSGTSTGGASTSSTGEAPSSGSTRPPHAAGLPDCRQ